MTADERRRVERLKRFAYLMDSAIRVPGTQYRVGLDPILGLVPGIGDAAAMGLSSYILLEARGMALPKSALTRMAVNIGVDTVVGSVPLLGDLFDAGFKANERNLIRLEEELDRRDPFSQEATIRAG